MAPDELFAQMGRWGRISLHRDASESLTLPAPDIRADRRADAPLTRLTSLLEASAEAGERIALVAETPGRLETLAQYLERESVATQTVADWPTLCARQPEDASVLTGVSPMI